MNKHNIVVVENEIPPANIYSAATHSIKLMQKNPDGTLEYLPSPSELSAEHEYISSAAEILAREIQDYIIELIDYRNDVLKNNDLYKNIESMPRPQYKTDIRKNANVLIKTPGQGITAEYKRFIVGEKVIANEYADEYAGLIGTITEIRDGNEKETDNPTPDIYVDFDMPTNPIIKDNFIESAARSFIDPELAKDIGIPLDSVICCPDEIIPVFNADNVFEVEFIAYDAAKKIYACIEGDEQHLDKNIITYMNHYFHKSGIKDYKIIGKHLFT